MFIFSNIKKLYDGTSASKRAIHQHVDVVVDNGLIQAVKPHDPTLTYPNATIIDCTKFTVTPGLVDCHLHMTVWDFDLAKMNSQARLLYFEKNMYKTLVQGGVTVARDMGGTTNYMRRLVNEQVILGPRIKTAVNIFCSTGGHADFRTSDCFCGQLPTVLPPEPGRPSCIVDGADACRQRVREAVACGADLIKICTSGGVISPNDHIEDRPFTQEEVAAFVDEAKAHGKRVAAHAQSPLGIAMAVEAGVYFIEHGTFIDKKLAKLVKKAGCMLTPTTWILHVYLAKNLAENVLKKANAALESLQHAVQLALEYDIPMLMGSDSVSVHMHGQNYKELIHMVKLGIPVLTAWYGATGLAATQVEEPKAGSIQAGQYADFLFFEKDVISNPELWDQHAMVEVVKDGCGYRDYIKELPQKSFVDTLSNTLEN